MKADGTPRRNDLWREETHHDVPAPQLSLWEQEGVYERLSAVHHTHRPVSEGAR
jgi:hypothetical protein